MLPASLSFGEGLRVRFTVQTKFEAKLFNNANTNIIFYLI